MFIRSPTSTQMYTHKYTLPIEKKLNNIEVMG